jgi:hypothetical protein
MPTSVRVAVVLLSVLAFFLLAYALLLFLAREQSIDDLVADGADRDSAAQLVLLFLLAYGLLGCTAALSAVFLPLRRSWARLTGLLVTSLMAVLTVVSFITIAAVTPVTLFVLVAAIGGVASLRARTTRDWLAELPRR